MMRPTPSFKIHTHHYWILFRESLVDQSEVEAANKFFNVTFQHELIPTGSVVIPRYSALPFYQYLEEGIHALGSRLIQDYRQHRFVADMQNWYHHLENVTPKTWFSLEEFGWDNKKLKPDCSFVLKGATNSKKNQWSTHMFAQTVQDVMKVHSNLMQDSLVGDQPIYIRKFVELNPVGTRVDNRPVTEEYRVFILDGKILCKAFYWSEYADVVAPEHQDPNNIPESFLEGILDAIGDEIRFYVVDVARTKKGNWMVEELCDGLMSGLSMCDPEEMYGNLLKGLQENPKCYDKNCKLSDLGKEQARYCTPCARRLYREMAEKLAPLEPANGLFAGPTTTMYNKDEQ